MYEFCVSFQMPNLFMTEIDSIRVTGFDSISVFLPVWIHFSIQYRNTSFDVSFFVKRILVCFYGTELILLKEYLLWTKNFRKLCGRHFSMCLIQNISVYMCQHNVYTFCNNMRLVTHVQPLIVYWSQSSFPADLMPNEYFYRTVFQFAKIFLNSYPIFLFIVSYANVVTIPSALFPGH